MIALPSALRSFISPQFAALLPARDTEPDHLGAMGIRRRKTALRVLVVEDNPIIAVQIAMDLREEGHQVLGPYSKLGDINLDQLELDGAILDVYLGHEVTFPLAEALRDRGLAVVFYTGSAMRDCPASLRDVPWLSKPASSTTLSGAFLREASRLMAAHACLALVHELRAFAVRQGGGDQASSDAFVARALRNALTQVQHDGLADPKAWLMADITRQIRQSAEWSVAFKEQIPPQRLI